MAFEIIRLSLGGIGDFNCYLLKRDGRRILIDTGVRRLRQKLISSLDDSGCEPDIATGGDVFEDFPSDELAILHTPGFTPGSICLLVR